jgi:hypothetical protein
VRKTWLKYLVLGGVVYLGFIIVRFPAELAYSFVANTLKSSPAKIELYRVEGTVWSGRAQYMRASGQTLRDVKWELHPLSLLAGSASATLGLKTADGSIKARVFKGFGDSIRLENVKARLPMKEIMRMAKLPAIQLEGQLGINLQEIEMAGGILTEAAGRIVWNGAETRFPQQLVLGDLAADIKNTDAGIQADISDAGGPLEAKGSLTLAPDGAYDFNGQFAAREGRNSTLGRSLNMMGRPDPQGKIKLTNKGNLKDFGFLVK